MMVITDQEKFKFMGELRDDLESLTVHELIQKYLFEKKGDSIYNEFNLDGKKKVLSVKFKDGTTLNHNLN